MSDFMKVRFDFGAQKLLSKNTALTLALIAVGAGVFVFSYPAHALFGIEDTVAKAFVWAFGQLVQMLVGLLGTFLINLFYVLVAVAQYNHFLASTAVTEGWIVMRDLVNMFFVLVLIVIAIGTILQQQQYHYSQTLPKFLVAAILVNFSKTICGIFIDATQVVMMTFVGAISGALGGNIAALLGIPVLLKQVAPWRENQAPSVEVIAFAGFFLALAFIVISLIVVGIMVVMLVIRIVALWFLIILSPAAFFLMSLPNDRGYFSKWLDQFINYLLVGPVMMFFLWLSLTVVASQQGVGVKDATQIQIATELGINFIDEQKKSGVVVIGGDWLGSTGIGTVGGIAGYILGICMLMATLMAAQQLSSVGGNIAGAGAGYVKDWFAGKRGPFNPFRAARETFGGVMARREERRKERVQKRVERFDRALGMAQQVPRELAKMGARTAIDRVPGIRQARDFYRSERVQAGLDSFVRATTFGVGGWGERHKVRREEFRKTQFKIIEDEKAKIGPARDEIAGLEKEAARLSLVGTPAAKADAQHNMDRANVLRQGVERGEMKVQQAQGKLVLDSMREGAFSMYGKAARLLATGAMGGAPILYAPPIFDEMGQRGAESQNLAEHAQASAVSESAKKFSGDSVEKINAKLAGSIPGFERVIDKMGLLMAKLEKGGFESEEIDGVRADLMGLGADTPTMEAFEALVAHQYPAQSLEVLRDPTKMGDVIRRKQLDPEKFSESGMTQDLLQTIREENEFDWWLDKAGNALSKAMHEKLEDELDRMEAARIHIDAAGNYTKDYKDLLLDFSKFGGAGSAVGKRNMNARLHLEDSGARQAGRYTAADENFMQEIASSQTYAPAFAGLTEGAHTYDAADAAFVPALRSHGTRNGIGAFRRAKKVNKSKNATEKKLNAVYDFISETSSGVPFQVREYVKELHIRD